MKTLELEEMTISQMEETEGGLLVTAACCLIGGMILGAAGAYYALR